MVLYEAMVLLENNFARENWEKAKSGVEAIISKNGGKIEKAVKWDERKLAYEIKKHKRGTYMLVHFTAPTSAVAAMEKEFKLVDFILRVMILRDTDGIDSPEPSEATNVVASY